jgi:hypothetical protein
MRSDSIPSNAGRSSSTERTRFICDPSSSKRDRFPEYRLTGDPQRPAQHQEADGHDPTPSDAHGYARPRDTH